ncbi:adenine deaminase [candidate division KSB1 bacterium]|nr:MAG: adenine deaminase [candidate division KSB1 bacterium]
MNIPNLQSLLAVARGDRPADLLLQNARIVNTLSYEIEEASVAIFGGRIAGFGDYQARDTMDLRGALLAPAFIDGHIHIESSLLTPAGFARAVVPWGTGSVVCDPHEIANVCGVEGIRFMLAATEQMPLDVFVMLPSCVPATNMETAGAELSADDLRPLLSHPRVLGLAEVMNFPGVVFGDENVLRKIEMAEGKPVDGHAPSVSGKWLNAYAAAGIETDHESMTLDEAREKLRRGIAVLIREGSTARNLDALLPLVTPANAHRFAFVSDDRHADSLIREGHMNATLAKAVKRGLDPVLAVAMATSHTAEIFGRKDIGAIAPGRRANLIELESLKTFRPQRVWHDGRLVAENGKLLAAISETPAASVRGSVKLQSFSADKLFVPAKGKKVNVIDVIPDQIVTDKFITMLPVENGGWTADLGQDIAKLVVIERHGRGGTIGRGFVRGFGLKRGALASTVAHDSHNLICVGMSDLDMLMAIRALIEFGGGLVAVADGRVPAKLALPVAGLMSDQPAANIVRDIENLHRAARDLGCGLSAPFMALSFLALPVIPHLKLTDKGLIDVDQFKPIELAADN